MKIISKTKFPNNESRQDIKAEMYFLDNTDHPNITRIFDVFEDANDFCLVAEVMRGGDLENTKKGDIDPHKISHIIYQITYGLKYLHEKCIVHSDLKGGNVLLFEKQKTTECIMLEAKLTDFGLSTLVDPRQ